MGARLRSTRASSPTSSAALVARLCSSSTTAPSRTSAFRAAAAARKRLACAGLLFFSSRGLPGGMDRLLSEAQSNLGSNLKEFLHVCAPWCVFGELESVACPQCPRFPASAWFTERLSLGYRAGPASTAAALGN